MINLNTIPSGLEIAYTEQQLAALSVSFMQILATYITVVAICFLVLAVLMISASWCIFKKAGTGGWKALIPIYSDYTFYKIAWKKKYFFMMLVFVILGSVLISVCEFFPEYAAIFYAAGLVLTIVALVIDIKSIVKLAKVFGKRGGFAVGLIFLPIIFLPILGFGKAKYRRRKRRRRKKPLPNPENA